MFTPLKLRLFKGAVGALTVLFDKLPDSHAGRVVALLEALGSAGDRAGMIASVVEWIAISVGEADDPLDKTVWESAVMAALAREVARRQAGV